MCIIIFRVIGIDDDDEETPSLAVLLCFYVLLLLLLLLSMKISVSFFSSTVLAPPPMTKTGAELHFEHVTSEQGISLARLVYLYNLVSFFFAGTFAVDDDVGIIRRSR